VNGISNLNVGVEGPAVNILEVEHFLPQKRTWNPWSIYQCLDSEIN